MTVESGNNSLCELYNLFDFKRNLEEKIALISSSLNIKQFINIVHIILR